MRNQTVVQKITQERILSAATEVFAEQGFHKTTIREICSRAGVNVASVNYHFGSKENLYREVCLHALGLSARSQNHGRHLPEEMLSPEEQLERFIHSFLCEILDQSTNVHASKIMVWEMNEPSGIFDVIVTDIIKPHHERLCAIVAALLGQRADEELIKQCVLASSDSVCITGTADTSFLGSTLHFSTLLKPLSALHAT